MSINLADGVPEIGAIGIGKDIYKMLSVLCRTIAGPNANYNMLLHATNYLAQCPNALSNLLPLEESAVVAKIQNDLSRNLNVNKDTANEQSGRFLKSYHDLSSLEIDPNLRRKIITFFLYAMNMKLQSQTIKESPNTVLPPSNCSVYKEAEKKVDVAQEIALANTLLCTSNNSTNVKFNDQNRNKKCSKNTSSFWNNNMNSSSKTSGFHCHPYEPYISNSLSNVVNIQEVPYFFGLCKEFTKDQNSDIVQNVIYSFYGIEGTYLKKDCVTGRFKIDSIAGKNLNDVQAAMLLRLSELGFYRDCVVHFIDIKSGLSALGQVGQGFVAAVKAELSKYYGMVSMLHDQLNIRRLELIRNKQSPFPSSERLTLLKIAVWYTEPLHRLQWLTKISEACQTKKGGELASIVHSFIRDGCPIVQEITRNLLIAACVPMLGMMARWLLQGEIADTDNEFFVECLNEVGADRLWYDKYRLRPNMLPNFITTDLANKILVTGKSINFLCQICHDRQPVKGREELSMCIRSNPEHIFAHVPDTKLHLAIEAIYQHTSKRVLDIMVGPQKLLDHLQAMRRYLLLGQGDFIGILMENMKDELDKPATKVHTQDLSAIMDAALRCTNAQYDDPEVLNHLDVRIVTPYSNEIGWDIISLQYTVCGPLATMLEPSMGVYLQLFKPLWRMKHMEFVLSNKIWKDQKCNAKLLRPLANVLTKVSYRLNLFTSEMMHFVHQMQYYILFEVIECNWVELQKRAQAATALDDILTAHTEFLDTIKRGAFLDSNSGNISIFLESVYENIIRLEIWQNKFYELCFKELDSRQEFQMRIVESEKTGVFGNSVERKLERDQAEKIFEQILHSYYKSLEHISDDYEKAVRGFLLALNSNDDHNLQLFGIRLDFNEYYKKRDIRLNVPLTFEHMRMSSVFGAMNRSLMGSRFSTLN